MLVSCVQIESSTNQHGDFTSDDAYIDGMCVSMTAMIDDSGLLIQLQINGDMIFGDR